MTKPKFTSAQRKLVKDLVAEFETQRDLVAIFLEQVLVSVNQSTELHPLLHSIKSRIKDPNHLENKISRLLIKSQKENKEFDLTTDNILTKISDLAGIRILHLHTRQIAKIDKVLKDIFKEQKYELIEGPFARTWDDESREFFAKIGIQTQKSESMYTSVHYIIGSASRTPVTCEVQVRTLATRFPDVRWNMGRRPNSSARQDHLQQQSHDIRDTRGADLS